MHNPSPNRCLVFDLDTTLPFPTYFHKYVTETFRTDYAVSEEHHRYVFSFCYMNGELICVKLSMINVRF